MIFALTLDGHEEMSPREVREEEEKKKHSFGSSKSLSCSSVADEEAYLSDFPFLFQVLFLNLLLNYCHRCWLNVCFGDAPTASKSVSEKNG